MSKHLFLLILSIVFLVNCPALSAAKHITILYTANINGNINDCGCGPVPLGGITRVATFINEYKKQHPEAIVIDGGDFINSYSYPEFNQLIQKTVKLIPYDIQVPGDQEFVEGPEFAQNYFAAMPGTVLWTNGSGQQTEIKLQRMNSDLHFYGVLGAEAFEFIEPGNTGFFVDGVNLNPSQNGISVLVYHGRIAQLTILLKRYPQIDLVLLGHTAAEKLEINGIPVFGTNADAASLARIIIEQAGNGLKISGEQIPLDQNIAEDKQVQALYTQFEKYQQ
jgi:2',3'-cyclic-nucleotide 2'-phosphodiesterase (5'-nucleotidase family)